MTGARVVIIGGGHAAAQLCASLAERGFKGDVALVSDEPGLPYHRPPLSKGFIKNLATGPQQLRSEAAYREAGVALHLGDAAVSIDRSNRVVNLRSGLVLSYDRLVLATGARARQLPDALGATLTLRSMVDAAQIRNLLTAANGLTVVGGGYIGLELAASARLLGKSVRVLESAPRLLARTASPEVSVYLAGLHRAEGVDLWLDVPPATLAHELAKARAGHDLVVAGIGAEPETTLAAAAGLTCDNGILVDVGLRSIDDAAIHAIGDCANFPDADGTRRRIESVQNANDQARCVATAIAGGEAQAYIALPWFWSEQGKTRLQIAGLLPSRSERHLRAGRGEHEFSVLHYVDDRMCAVESVNAPLDHLAARKLLEQRLSPPPADAVCPEWPLKKFL